jgi:hypothetical protein
LAAGRYEALETSIALHNRWEPPYLSAATEDGARARYRPVVFVTTDRVAQYERQLAEQALRRS